MDLILLLLTSGKDETEPLKLEPYCPHAGQISEAMKSFPVQIHSPQSSPLNTRPV